MATSAGHPHPTRIFLTEEEKGYTQEKDMYYVFSLYKLDLKEQCEDWEKVQYVGKNGDRVTDTMKLPLTFEGFMRFCWDTGRGNIEQYFINKDKLYNQFVGVCSRIKNEIRENHITGGMLGVYNPSITQRLNGMSDKIEANIRLGVDADEKEEYI